MNEPLRIGVIGAGFVGYHHAKAIAETEGLHLSAVADSDDAARERLASEFHPDRSLKTWQEAVDDPETEAVLIATPNDLHVSITEAACSTGKHVLCEKPMARTLEEARAMIAAANRSGQRLFITLNRRFSHEHQVGKKLLDDGAIGRPFLATSAFIGNDFDRMNTPGHWKGSWERSGGGVVIDNGTHLIDVLRWWLGDVVEVSAQCRKAMVEPEDKAEDTAILLLTFASGAVAELSLTFCGRYSTWPPGYIGAAVRTDVYGTDGALTAGNIMPEISMVNVRSTIGRSEGRPGALDATLRDVQDVATIQTGMPKNMLLHFAECIREGAEPVVTAGDGLAAMEIVAAAYESNDKQRSVKISEVRGR